MYEKLISRSNYYTTENLLYFSYHQNNYKLIGIDFSKRTNTIFLQQINFVEKLEGDGATILLITEKKQKTIIKISLDSLI